MSRKKALLISYIISATAAFILWIAWGNITVGVTRYKIAAALPKSFSNFKIAVISDLHNAKFGKDNDSLTALVEAQSPDIIAITGDLVDSSRTDIKAAVDLVRALSKIAPCYYVTGNHEAWLGEQYAVLEAQLLDEGVVVLRDEVVALTRGDETIQIAGLDDPDFTDRNSALYSDIIETRLESMALTDDYSILLSHRPETFESYVNSGVDLILTGHAHGGQFRLPFVGGIIAPNQGLFPEYDSGLYCSGSTRMVVSRGIGNSIIPFRVNNRPEIVLIELKSTAKG